MTGGSPGRPGPQAPSFTFVHAVAVLTALLGVGMIVRALTAGGGAGSYGVIIGALFVAAGVARLRLLRARREEAGR